MLVVEVASPATVKEDLLDKQTRYAAAGIPICLVVLLDEKYEIAEIREFHLDAATTYRVYAVHGVVLNLGQPVRLTLPISDLVRV